jgi:hypothetical protein
MRIRAIGTVATMAVAAIVALAAPAMAQTCPSGDSCPVNDVSVSATVGTTATMAVSDTNITLGTGPAGSLLATGPSLYGATVTGTANPGTITVNTNAAGYDVYFYPNSADWALNSITTTEPTNGSTGVEVPTYLNCSGTCSPSASPSEIPSGSSGELLFMSDPNATTGSGDVADAYYQWTALNSPGAYTADYYYELVPA